MKSPHKTVILTIGLLICLGTLSAPQEDTLESLKSIALIEQKVMVPMRDGVRLATDIYRPKTDKPVSEVLNSENPGLLRLVSTTNAGSVPYGVYAKNGYVFITNNNDLLIFDIHNPKNPQKVGAVGTGVTFSVTVMNGLAFTVGESGLFIIDISDPANPKKLGALQLQGEGESIWLEGTLAYIATSAGLEIIDISDPTRPSMVSHCSEGPARGIALVDSIAYVANRINGLEVIDVASPANPQKVTTISGTRTAWNVHVHEDYLFLARHQYGVDIFSITDRKDPRKIGSFCDDDGGEALSVWGDKDYLYVADNFGVEVLDINDPAHPRQIEELGGLGCTHDIFVEGTKLFIASVEKGLIILEFTPE